MVQVHSQVQDRVKGQYRRGLRLPLPSPANISPPPSQRKSILYNLDGWAFVYEIMGETVIISRIYRGKPQLPMQVSVEASLLHYAALRRQGFLRPDEDI